MNTIKLSELSDNLLSDRQTGFETRQKIKQLVIDSENNVIEIDMENITSVTPSFIEEAIVKLVLEYGKEDFKNKVKLLNTNPSIKQIMNTMLAHQLKTIKA